MLRAMPAVRGWACFLLSCLAVVGPDTAATGQEDQSGARAGPVIAPVRLDDALIPVDLTPRSALEAVDLRDTATEARRADGPVALSAQLAGLDEAQRANAEIGLELSEAEDALVRDAAAGIAELWNGGDHETALSRLRVLEETGVPLALGISWRQPVALTALSMVDNRIGGERSEAQTMSIDYDAQTGHVFAVVRWGSTTSTSAWTMNISTDDGVTWAESYAFGSATGIVDVDGAVVDDYVYVAYVAGSAANEARIRRCLVSTGGVDTTFGFHVALHAGANTVEEVALAANADDFDNRIYYAIVQDNNVLRYAYDVATDGTTFQEESPAASNPEFGLDMTWDHSHGACAEFIYVSYAGNDGHIHVLGHNESAWTDWIVETEAGSHRSTAISAYGDSVICAFEYPYSNGTGIRYRISYGCGNAWAQGSIAVPDGSSIFGYFEPDVDARDGDGTAIIYQAEAGEFDPMYYRTRAGFAPGAWSDPALYNDHDVYTGSDTALAFLPPVAGERFSHGTLYLSLDPDFRTPYFDRPLTSGPSCGDITAPVVTIDSPDTLACACGQVDVTGAVGDPEGTYLGDRLEIRRRGSSTWDEVVAGVGERSGTLYTWDTTDMAPDFYDLRIVAENECGLSNSDTTLVYVPTGFDTLELSSPAGGGVYGGKICLDGTAWTQSCFVSYSATYRQGLSLFWKPVDPTHPVYGSPVINGSLAHWEPRTLGLADGDYSLRITGETECGGTASATTTITVDNSPPVARLEVPEHCDVVVPGTVLEVHGEVFDTNLDEWTVAVTGGSYDGWQTITGPKTSNASGFLGEWDTTGLPACAYVIRLQASDTSMLDCGSDGHVAEDYAIIALGGLASADLDQDGDVDIVDFMLFELQFTGPMP